MRIKMGKRSTKENKNIYQLRRENMDWTRERASEQLAFMSADRIEKIESEKSLPHPDEILAMSKCYKSPDLCNYLPRSRDSLTAFPSPLIRYSCGCKKRSPTARSPQILVSMPKNRRSAPSLVLLKVFLNGIKFQLVRDLPL